MYPPTTNPNMQIDLTALSGITGSISIACWVVVFSPQIIENFRRKSADGLSIVFIIVWLLGDVFNILGAVLQGVLPTMTVLAVYYTLADIVLLGQVWWYRGFTLSDTASASVVARPAVEIASDEEEGERRPLLAQGSPGIVENKNRNRSSFSEEFRRHLSAAGGQHLSPATPLLDATRDSPAIKNQKPTSPLQTFLFNTGAILLVCAAGVLGWYISLSRTSQHHTHHGHGHYDKHAHDSEPVEPLHFDTLGQLFGYLCAAFYLASRVPQLLLNYRRKSTEGVSLLFFLFACIGNLTYDMSIFAYDPVPACRFGPRHCEFGEAGRIYRRYIAVNASWIAGSLGTLLLDGAIFVQFFLYKKDEREEGKANGRVNAEEAIED